MTAISIRPTPSGTRVVVVQQELVFFIGPCAVNRLETTDDYKRRFQEVAEAIDTKTTVFQKTRLAIESAYGVRLDKLSLSVRQGGKRGVSCPNLCIDLVESFADDGTPLFQISDPKNGAACCRGLIDQFDADWVDVWWTGSLGNAQINCDRGAKAICIKSNGQKEEV